MAPLDLASLLARLRKWSPADYASVIGAAVSVVAALISVGGAQKRLRWDAGKELGEFRVETLELLSMAFRLDNPTWRRVGLKAFAEAQREWVRSMQRHAPTIGKRAYRELLALSELFDQAKAEALGMPLGGLAAEEAQYDENFVAKDLSRGTSAAILAFWDGFKKDRGFLSH